MKTLLTVLILLFSFFASSQNFKKGDAVEVDLLMSSSREGTWQTATVTDFDPAGKMYTIKLSNGIEMGIPSRNPERWIRATNNKPVLPEKPDLKYETTAEIVKPKGCGSSEAEILQRIKAQTAITFYNYEKMAFSFASFKQDAPYQKIDSIYGRLTIYPFKVEYQVDLLHKYTQGGKEYTEHKIWKFSRKYIFYRIPGGDCEFGIAEGTAGKLVLSETL